MNIFKYIYFFLIFIIILFTIYNYILYKWCNKNIFNYNQYLSNIEKNYILLCIFISSSELFKSLRFNPFIYQLSFYTFSSEFKNNKMNSSRLAFGTTVLPELLYYFAKKILKQKNIKLI